MSPVYAETPLHQSRPLFPALKANVTFHSLLETADYTSLPIDCFPVS